MAESYLLGGAVLWVVLYNGFTISKSIVDIIPTSLPNPHSTRPPHPLQTPPHPLQTPPHPLLPKPLSLAPPTTLLIYSHPHSRHPPSTPLHQCSPLTPPPLLRRFVRGLREELSIKYPLHSKVQPQHHNQMTHLYFPSRLSLWEILILILYCCLFLSVYFSIRKIDILSSKIGISITVLVTLISSLCLAVGTCAYWGLKPLHSQGKYVYPALAGLVGFENSMVLIRCVASTPQHLDVKIRVARGLAREGWTITKYFLSMITLVTISFFLFIPIVQEICIYGSLVLLCDLYMQLLFLTAVLSIDVQRCHDSKQHLKQDIMTSGLINSNRHGSIRTINSHHNIDNRTGIPNLHRRHASAKASSGEDRLAPPLSEPKIAASGMPKRLRITYFVTSKRMFQRMIMCVFVGWIAWIVYNTTGLYDNWEHASHNGPGLASVIHSIKTKYNGQFATADKEYRQEYKEAIVDAIKKSSKDWNTFGKNVTASVTTNRKLTTSKLERSSYEPAAFRASTDADNSNNKSTSYQQLVHRDPYLTDQLPETHWPTLFG